MDEQFVSDQLTWRSTWRRRMKQVGQQLKAVLFIGPLMKIVKSFFPTRPLETIIILLTLIYLVALYFVFVIYAEPLGLYANFEVNNWYKRRSFGIWLAGSLAPLLALLGYFLSARRTETMQYQNQLKRREDNQAFFFEAAKMVEKDGLPSTAGIEALVHLAQTEKSNIRPTIALLRNRLLQVARKPSEGNQIRDPGINPIVETLLNALIRVQAIRYDPVPLGFISRIELDSLDLRNLNVLADNSLSHDPVPVIGFTFKDCWLQFTHFRSTRFSNVWFLNSDLTNANFTKATFVGDSFHKGCGFRGSNMLNTVINHTDFFGVFNFEQKQLINCSYQSFHPPKNLPQNVDLPSPCHTGSDLTTFIEGGHYTRADTLQFYSAIGVNEILKFRPMTRQETPVPIYCVDAPSNPITKLME
tara:strand:- start:86 stop:1330 length:1245 start_codon:yes stop_codon:yes gene_type:complete